ncbi:MAG: hypothetical protein ACLQVI_21825, partial [Polyangiaceae bacterium]
MHAYVPQDAGATTSHPPSPVHAAPGVPTPSMHDATPHVVVGPTRLVQAFGFVPSQIFDVQGLFMSDCGHAGRVGGL